MKPGSGENAPVPSISASAASCGPTSPTGRPAAPSPGAAPSPPSSRRGPAPPPRRRAGGLLPEPRPFLALEEARPHPSPDVAKPLQPVENPLDGLLHRLLRTVHRDLRVERRLVG